MVISDDDAPAAPAGPAMSILLKGIGAAAVLATWLTRPLRSRRWRAARSPAA